MFPSHHFFLQSHSALSPVLQIDEIFPLAAHYCTLLISILRSLASQPSKAWKGEGVAQEEGACHAQVNAFPHHKYGSFFVQKVLFFQNALLKSSSSRTSSAGLKMVGSGLLGEMVRFSSFGCVKGVNCFWSFDWIDFFLPNFSFYL